ncbi:ATP-dependent helicase [Spelaeicoccus albus]|uniref:DNA 3'-5' helicase n=1 Tax=Spelaeicoccus albus TaxID=1280376 RepID=A0A7Z0IHZ8_9MICO|nr:ATP-dependent DNA helicase [Spelaeicoccus albus]NYI68103.1 DNA helicase-2/ATP-dependent DNA helicase PcrA [Spelaeicoccus albus]
MNSRPRYSATAIAAALGQHTPTPEQAAIIEAPLDPLLVVAGAGSGKTETMAARVVWLVANAYVRPEEILGLTFTRKAAGELAERIRLRLGTLRRRGLIDNDETGLGLDVPTVATYNGYAAGLVKDHGLRLAVEPDAQMLTDAGRWQIAHEVVRSAGADELGDFDTPASTITKAVLSLAGGVSEHLQQPSAIADLVDSVLTRVESLPRDAKTAADTEVRGGNPGRPYAEVKKDLSKLAIKKALVPLVERFNRLKTDRGYLDFGDQVRLAEQLARTMPAVREGERARWSVVMLDEYQDTSYSQLKLLTRLFGDGHSVTAVGDPLQSIYGWRGASAGNLEDFPLDFSSGGRPAAVKYLSTSWRNDTNILRTANLLARPIRDPDAPPLAPAPTAGEGDVVASVSPDYDTEVGALVEWVSAQRTLPGNGDGAPRSIAVLCRRRSLFPAIEGALRLADIPVQVIGLGGLLSTPEVSDIVETLRVVDDPGRGDALMRLLTGNRWRLGAADIAALARYSRRVHGVLRDDTMESDAVDRYSVADGLDSLSARDDRHEITADGLDRMMRLAAMLRRLRRKTSGALPDLVRDTERELLLDVEVAARPGYSPGMARTHLDAFADVAAKFVMSGPAPTLGAFLSWIDAAESEERGLAVRGVEPVPGAVQLMTVHAAKGLEWDAVAIPQLVEDVFPAKARSTAGWLDLPSLPYELRGDRSNLPVWHWRESAHQAELNEERNTFRKAVNENYLSEERRLSYVAMTRARRALWLGASYWGDGKTPRSVSRFVTELVDAGLIGADDWPEAPAKGDEKPAPSDTIAPQWPAAAGTDAAAVHRSAAAEMVRAREAGPESREHVDGAIRGEIDMLLAEREAGRSSGIALPSRLSPTRLVGIDADPEAAAMRLARPMPRGPSRAARLGTAFHAWLESGFGQAALLEPHDVAGSTGGRAADAADGHEADLAALKQTFTASRFADREPVAVESGFEMRLGPVTVPGKIDAVYHDADGYEIVDWKTGRRPDADRLVHTRLQLAVYRLAYAERMNVPPEQIRATFFFLGSNSEVNYPGPDGELPDEAELVAALGRYYRAD